MSNVHFGVTAACVDNGTAVPNMNPSNLTLFGESQYTKHAHYNKNGSPVSVSMYIPSSTFSSFVGN